MARQFRKGIDYSVAFEARLKRIGASYRTGFEVMVGDVLDDMKELTSGTVSTAELRRMGHPFARGPRKRTRSRLQRGSNQPQGRATVKRLPINKQGGRLQRSLASRKVAGSVSRLAFDVGSIYGAGGSIFVLLPDGTRKMVGRGFWREVHRRLRARRDGLAKYAKARHYV